MALIDDIKRDRDVGGDDMPTGVHKVPNKVSVANTRRRSVERVLSMEAALLAMREAMEEATQAAEELGDPETAFSIIESAYRKATGEAGQ